jgi:hypothetical protein
MEERICRTGARIGPLTAAAKSCVGRVASRVGCRELRSHLTQVQGPMPRHEPITSVTRTAFAAVTLLIAGLWARLRTRAEADSTTRGRCAVRGMPAVGSRRWEAPIPLPDSAQGLEPPARATEGDRTHRRRRLRVLPPGEQGVPRALPSAFRVSAGFEARCRIADFCFSQPLADRLRAFHANRFRRA